MELPLSPQIDKSRMEFGYYATSCSCVDCSFYCKHMPGYLIPDDLRRLSGEESVKDICEWADGRLLASPGAIVATKGGIMRVPTLVPRKLKQGCIWLADEKGGCMVHAKAPFGCRFFNTHEPDDRADYLSKRGLAAIMQDWCSNGIYSIVWNFLNDKGQIAQPPEELRKEAREAYEKER